MTKKYDSYKASGVEWLGEIPNHWFLKKLNEISEFITCGVASTPEYTNKEKGVLFLSAQNINDKFKVDLKKASYIKKELHEKLTINRKPEINDILYIRVGATIGRGAVVEIVDDFSVYVSLTHIRVKKDINPYFINYYISNENFKNLMLSKQIAGGGVGNLNVDTLRSQYIPLPLLKEQKLIANYLDEKTSSIDNSIETLKSQKERLIGQKKAIIHKAVTKGLDDSVEMKDSGVEWIGDIPKHWKIEHLKNLINYKTGNTPDSKKSSYYGNENDYPWANISDLNNKNIYTTKKTLTKEGVIAKNLNIVKENSLLFSFKLSVGNCSFNRIQLYTNEAIASFEENKKISLNWLYYFMSYFFINNSKENIYGAPILNRDLIENGKILKISKIEQELIANYLDEKTSKIEEAVNEVEKQINLLEEYKKTLINDVVTGKIKVF